VFHNAYGMYSGEEAAVEREIHLLCQRGHEVSVYWRSSAELSHLRLGRLRAFVAGIFAPGSRTAIRGFLEQNAPAIVHFHNLFPLISPSVLPELRKQGIPGVMTVHNYRLVCPNGLHMSKKTLTVCEKCCGGKEYWCILRNCEASMPKSIGYALRNWVARSLRLFLDNVAAYVCLTQFQRQRLICEGFPADRVTVVPNMAEDSYPALDLDDAGTYVGYVGRISPEKGVDKLLAAAKELQSIPFQAAGSYDSTPHLPSCAPKNFRFLGFLDRKVVPQFILGSRFMVLCSTWFEGFPMAVVEAMIMGKAVVASKIGGMPELVDDHVTGLLFEPGNAGDLTEKIRYLWDRPGECRRMGQAGREKALREYSPQKHYERLMAVYEKAITVGPPGWHKANMAGTEFVEFKRKE